MGMTQKGNYINMWKYSFMNNKKGNSQLNLFSLKGREDFAEKINQ
jgi:hypothetical protein